MKYSNQTQNRANEVNSNFNYQVNFEAYLILPQQYTEN